MSDHHHSRLPYCRWIAIGLRALDVPLRVGSGGADVNRRLKDIGLTFQRAGVRQHRAKGLPTFQEQTRHIRGFNSLPSN